jgi:hypothetical protein
MTGDGETRAPVFSWAAGEVLSFGAPGRFRRCRSKMVGRIRLAVGAGMSAGPRCMSRRPLFSPLIPVDVTGIQPRGVCRVRRPLDVLPIRTLPIKSPASMDMDALDSCDKHRNEGWEVSMPQNRIEAGEVFGPQNHFAGGKVPEPQSCFEGGVAFALRQHHQRRIRQRTGLTSSPLAASSNCMSARSAPTSLIPVLVTGIQCVHVHGRERLFREQRRSGLTHRIAAGEVITLHHHLTRSNNHQQKAGAPVGRP